MWERQLGDTVLGYEFIFQLGHLKWYTLEGPIENAPVDTVVLHGIGLETNMVNNVLKGPKGRVRSL